jgi:PrtD family type I secretion system ABC transporter
MGAFVSSPNRTSSDPLRHARSRVNGAIVVVVVFSFFINLLMFATPLYMLQVYDRVLTSRNEMTLVMLTILAVSALAVFGILELVRSRVLVRTGQRLDNLLSSQTFLSAFKAALSDQRGGHAQALRDLDQVRDFLSGAGLIALCDAPWVPLFIGLIFLFHPVLGLVALAAATVIFALATANEFATRAPLRAASRASNKAHTFAETTLRNAQAAAPMGMMPNLIRHWQAQHQTVIRQQSEASDRAGLILSTSKAVRMIFQVAILGAGGYLVLQEATTPGTMIAASIVMGRALAPVEQAVGQWRNFVNARTAYDRLRQTLRAVQTPSGMSLPAPSGRVTAERVTVVPPGGTTPVVRGVSFEVAAGEFFGIIGPSGAGKSSLARTLLGVWRPAAGTVRLDGADISDWDDSELGPYIGYLPQDIELFDGTVAQNIARFGRIDYEQVVLAAKTAGAHETILRLADGYDTEVGPGGAALSGGQKRAVGLARALYGDVRFVVLDEPNANLDHDGEQFVLSALDKLKSAGVTTVVITHRVQLLRAADRIMSLQEGSITALGSRDEVVRRFVGAVPGRGQDGAAGGANTGGANAGRGPGQ